MQNDGKLYTLTEDDMPAMGTTVGHVKQFMERIERLETENADLRKQLADGLRYATEICKWMAEAYPAVAAWKPLDDLFGVLSQIDNMWCGFKERLAEAQKHTLYKVVAGLKQQLAEAQKDTERLDWLLENEVVQQEIGSNGWALPERDGRAALDGAMGK